VPAGYRHFIARDFDPEHRARRIKELIASRPKHDVESFRAMQQDAGERFAMDVLPLMLEQTAPTSERAREAIRLLERWDMHMSPDRAEPLIFAAWMRAFIKALTADELGELFERLWADRPDFVTAVVSGDRAATRFCDDVGSKGAVESCGSALSKSLDAALDELGDRYGGDIGAWRWDAAHQATFAHTPFGFVPVLRDVFGLREPMGGGVSTIQRAAYRYSNREPFAAVHGSGYRAVYDLAQPNASLYIIATGQSGNVYSPYYATFVKRWARGEYLGMTTDRATIEAQAANVLTLQPTPADKPR
jgi:penicillin amidase